MFDWNVILFNNRFTVNTFLNAGKVSGPIYKGYYNEWYCTNDESLLSNSQVMEVEMTVKS